MATAEALPVVDGRRFTAAKQRSTIVPRKTRDDIYRYLFTEGVMVCEKDRLGTWEGMLSGSKVRCPALQVMYLMNSFKSRGLIDEQFAWRHYYWKLNQKGEEYLREYLHLAADVVPNTQRGDESGFERRGPGGRGRGGRGGRGRGRGGDREGGDRDGYRRDGFRGRGRGRGRSDAVEGEASVDTAADVSPAAEL